MLAWEPGSTIGRRNCREVNVSAPRWPVLRRPRLVLADEPTGNLDRTSAAAVGDLLLEMQQQEGAMLIVVTHSLELARRFGRQYELDEGQLKQVELAA